YLCLLDSRARLVLGRVGDETRPAQHLLESLGFTYLHEVDPFDGGPHYGANLADIELVKNGKWSKLAIAEKGAFASRAFVGLKRDGEFRAVFTAYDHQDGAVQVPAGVSKVLEAETGEKIFYSAT
ncbi:MAG: arginine N-succinyltransferase, partial [Bdellovibrionota bacterium]